MLEQRLYLAQLYDIYGPLLTDNVQFADAVPTYKELAQMKGKVYNAGVENDGTSAYVMTPEMYAILEATSRDAGSGRMIIEDGKIAGVPVFQTAHINGIGFGVCRFWSEWAPFTSRIPSDNRCRSGSRRLCLRVQRRGR